MNRRLPWWAWIAGVALIVLAARWVLRFPWREMGQAVAAASLPLAGLAALVNLASFLAKGTAWHLLLRPVAPNRWRTAMSATLIGAAINNIGVAVTGEAARIHVVMQRDRVPLNAAVSSVLWSRITEGIGLAFFVVACTWVMPLPPWVAPIRMALLAILALVLLVTIIGGWRRIERWLPAWARNALAGVADIGRHGRLALPVSLGITGWLAEWATYHLSMEAVCGHVPLAASFLALMTANIGGIPRLTPGNVGILQASFVIGLAPFGISAERAIAAGLVSQAIQVFPLMLVAGLAAGSVRWHDPGLAQNGPTTAG